MIGDDCPRGPNDGHDELFRVHPDLDWYGILSDDVIPRTEKWDEILIRVAGRDKFAYCDDGFQHENLAPHPVIGGDFVRAVGWITLQDVTHSFVDTAMHVIAVHTRRAVYVRGPMLEHMHPLANKAPQDETYRYAKFFTADQAAFWKWQGRELRQVVERVNEKLGRYAPEPVRAA